MYHYLDYMHVSAPVYAISATVPQSAHQGILIGDRGAIVIDRDRDRTEVCVIAGLAIATVSITFSHVVVLYACTIFM